MDWIRDFMSRGYSEQQANQILKIIKDSYDVAIQCGTDASFDEWASAMYSLHKAYDLFSDIN
jgi:hypothetical protein